MASPRTIYNVALIGLMGTGKSSVGRLLASMLHFDFLDTDELIESRTGQKISQIFAQAGEPVFRGLEAQIVQELSESRGVVISTGGGLGANPDHLAQLKRHSLVVCLWASPEAIWRRVCHQSHRPLLADPNPRKKIEDLLEVRAPVYKQADVLINTEMRSLKEVAQNIAHQFRDLAQA